MGELLENSDRCEADEPRGISPVKTLKRIHPNISLHSHADSTWGYTDPPLDRLPADLENLYVPDPGWPWLRWTWTDMDIWMVAALSGFVPWKGWLPSDMRHGLEIALNVPHPTTVQKQEVAMWSVGYPKVAAWMRSVGEQARTTRMVRAWTGRRYVFSPLDTNVEREACKWVIAAGMQGIFNSTFLAIKERYGVSVVFKYGKRDGMMWGVRADVWGTAVNVIKEIVTKPHVGKVEFPATFKEVWP